MDAVSAMRRGRLILYPTDTVWGIGCDACDPDAVSRIFRLKRRADSKAMISLVDSEAMLAEYVDVPGGVAPHETSRPTTVVYPGARGLAPNLVSDDGSVALRLTREAYSAALCRALGRPVVSTSANISGMPAARIFAEIAPEIIAGVDYVALYRRDDETPAAPSRVVKLAPDGSLTVLRP